MRLARLSSILPDAHLASSAPSNPGLARPASWQAATSASLDWTLTRPDIVQPFCVWNLKDQRSVWAWF